MTSPVLHYVFDDSNLGTDSSGSGLDLTNNGVVLVTDAVRGAVASFDGTSSLVLPSASLPSAMTGGSSRSFMLMAKRSTGGGSSFESIIQYGGGSFFTSFAILVNINSGTVFGADFYGGNHLSSTVLDTDIWYHLTLTYGSGTVKTYVDGVQVFSSSESINTGSSDVTIGESGTLAGAGFSGLMSDFRVYDSTLSASEVLADYELQTNTMVATPWSTLVQASWPEFTGATSYRLTHDVGSGEVVSVESTDLLESVVYNLEPETLYTLRVYYSIDDVNYILHMESYPTTLEDTPGNSNMAVFLVDGAYDFTGLDEATQLRLEEHIDDVLMTGDDIVVDNQDFKKKKFRTVSRGSTSTIPDGQSILFPFNPLEGSSQSATLELSDTTNVVITYDDSTNNIVVGGVTYSPGDVFIMDGKKVRVFDV